MESTEEKASKYRAAWLTRQAETFDRTMALCDSPIERLFLAALIVEFGWRWPEEGYPDYRAGFASNQYALTSSSAGRLVSDDCVACCLVQPSMACDGRQIRLDFAFVSLFDDIELKVAVELDGHDFHERTKAQARRDKARDRALHLGGWTVLRFTGSEVFENAAKCVDDVLELITTRHTDTSTSKSQEAAPVTTTDSP